MIITLPERVSRPGFQFGGWNVESNGSGTNYPANGQYRCSPSDVTLYARWWEVKIDGGGTASAFSSDGYAIYNQFDPRWQSDPQGGIDPYYSIPQGSCDNCAKPFTIARDGCGPASYAMAITALTGKTVTPKTVVDYAVEVKASGMSTSGTERQLIIDTADHFGLRYDLSISSQWSVGAVNQVLASGGMVWVCGGHSDPNNGGTAYTDKGHCIVIRGVTAGRWKVFDSYWDQSIDGTYSPDAIISYGGGDHWDGVAIYPK